MPKMNSDNLKGNATKRCSVALLLLDILTDFDFPGGDMLSEQASLLIGTLPPLIRRARHAGVPIVYVNDNWGQWRSDLGELLRKVLRLESRGRDFVRSLMPIEQDYVVLKPKHSGFFGTSLDLLLASLEVRTLVLAGLAGNICVLFTAHDAHMRDYKLVIPRDGVASQTPWENEWALRHLRQVLGIATPLAADVDFNELRSGAAIR